MPDLLVPLYKLPSRQTFEDVMTAQGIVIRRPMTYELSKVREFITQNFSQTWADETAAAFGRQPISAVIAVEGTRLVGFAAFDATARGYFGPTGVAESCRGRGIGQALLIGSLWSLRDLGYHYAIIGAAGPVDFYVKTVGAIPIPESVPGIYPPTLTI